MGDADAIEAPRAREVDQRVGVLQGVGVRRRKLRGTHDAEA
jgi:hypothetical protein